MLRDKTIPVATPFFFCFQDFKNITATKSKTNDMIETTITFSLDVFSMLGLIPYPKRFVS
jgi:hypothetical protein